MIDLQRGLSLPSTESSRFNSFAGWRASVRERGLLPVIGVTGSRGKTTVVRLLNAIVAEAGLQSATRTNVSVDIRGKRQRGELAPWTRAMDELGDGTLDLAIEEIDWLTIHTMGLERATYPVFAMTNVCGNRDACLIQGDMRRAIASLPTVFEATDTQGVLVINADDFDISREEMEHDRPAVFVGLNRESPGLRGHLERGGSAAWLNHGSLVAGSANDHIVFASAADLRFALFGRAGFQVQNALTAAAAAHSIGIDPGTIERALQRFNSADTWMPDSFQVMDIEGISVVVDRPNPSWFLRPVLRSIRDLGPNRVISVVGRLSGVPVSDLPEVGRLLGRVSSLFVAHSQDEEPHRSAAVRQGTAMNDVPPMIVHTRTEGRALSRALAIARPGDLVLILADRPAPLTRTLRRSSRHAMSPA